LARIATIWAIFQGLLIEALPFLFIGVLIAGLARWIAPGGRWLKRLPDQPILAPLSGAALGFALPACECGNVPVARRLLAGGASMGSALGFLFAAPVLNPIVLASTWAAFPDQPWLIAARPLGALLVAVVLSGVLQRLPEGQLLERSLLAERRLSQPLAEASLLERKSGVLGIPPPPRAEPSRPSLRTVLEHSTREFLNLAVLLILGSLIAATVQTLLPRSWLLAVGGAPTLSILSLMLMAVVISVCSSVDAFLALGFAAQITPGALLAFLVLGPVVDLKLLGLFGVIMRPKAIAITAIGATVVVLLLGQWVNLWLL
jgi:uncharacterized membrane protein YraQ (UPF0718 family)